MSTDINPQPGTHTELVQDLGEQLLNLYMVMDRKVGYQDAIDLLDEVFSAVSALLDTVRDEAAVQCRTDADKAAGELLKTVTRRLFRANWHTIELRAAGDAKHSKLLRTLLADVFDISITCLTSDVTQ
jgi:hypothetical protein